MLKGVVFDLDDTLVDTALLRALREARRWKEAVARLHETRLFDGIDELMRELGVRELPWAIVTTSVSYYANKVITHHGLEGGVCVAYHDAAPKPSPAPIALALKRMSLRREEVVGVGDAETDLRAYQAAGVRAVGAGWSPVLHSGSWDTVATKPIDLLAL